MSRENLTHGRRLEALSHRNVGVGAQVDHVPTWVSQQWSNFALGYVATDSLEGQLDQGSLEAPDMEVNNLDELVRAPGWQHWKDS